LRVRGGIHTGAQDELHGFSGVQRRKWSKRERSRSPLERRPSKPPPALPPSPRPPVCECECSAADPAPQVDVPVGHVYLGVNPDWPRCECRECGDIEGATVDDNAQWYPIDRAHLPCAIKLSEPRVSVGVRQCHTPVPPFYWATHQGRCAQCVEKHLPALHMTSSCRHGSQTHEVCHAGGPRERLCERFFPRRCVKKIPACVCCDPKRFDSGWWKAQRAVTMNRSRAFPSQGQSKGNDCCCCCRHSMRELL